MTARRTGIASVATLAALCLTVGTVHAVAPEWARRLGLDVWNASALEDDLTRSQARGRQLTADGERLVQQIEVSDRLTGELAAGRMSLAVAVAELVRVNESRVGFAAAARLEYPSAVSDTELTAQYALDKVRRLLRGDPSRAADVLARLSAEYHALTGKPWHGRD